MYGSSMTPSLRNPRLQGRVLPGGGYAGDQAPYDATAFSSELNHFHLKMEGWQSRLEAAITLKRYSPHCLVY